MNRSALTPESPLDLCGLIASGSRALFNRLRYSMTEGTTMRTGVQRGNRVGMTLCIPSVRIISEGVRP